ncbi:type I restriction endonuclease [Reichenbachiella sp.]|uniref:type I restriction endonuclease n=1 Tax=Reichenbachiella sp. TaxID=2184521 RepID=UPI003297503E
MENINFKIENVLTESDVEQKLISPLLIAQSPLGLGFSYSDFRTKPDLRKLRIGKGSSLKVYYPDYVVVKSGFPLIVIEAKRPGEDLEEAFREGRMYAAELNSEFEHDLNPCRKIIVSDGKRIFAGFWDSDVPIHKFDSDNYSSSDIKFSAFVDFACNETLLKELDELNKKLRKGKRFHKPTRMLGGKTVQNEELVPNSFGTTISLEFRNLFNPNTREERIDVVRNAYVKSRARLKHVDPIEKIIRGINPPSITNTTLIQDSSKPNELLNRLKQYNKLHGQLLLLVGNVGSGKSTFTDYVREVALPSEIKESTVWLYVDLNKAPLEKDYIYDWIKNNLIERFRLNFDDGLDLDSSDTLMKLFAVEVNQFKKRFAKLLGEGSEKYNEKLVDLIEKNLSDKDIHLKSLARFICGERGKLLVVVLDNCDKRNREDQLLMFDVANWLKEYLRCLVFLPLRNTTYDHHRKEPPLDTIIKDLVFRIEPPIFSEVLYKRINFALRSMSGKTNSLQFDLPNGMRVEYPQSEQGYFLACILKSVFQNHFFNRIITALTGRDIRKGLEIFLDFCKSGHISEDHIYKIRQSKGDFVLPNYLINRVLIRGNRKYFSDFGFVRNLFHSEPSDKVPNPFARISILRWLKNRYRLHGPNKTKGYHKVSDLIKELNSHGHSEKRISSEIKILIGSRLIATESQNVNDFEADELIIITSSGFVHLELLDNLDYVSSSSEDIWYNAEGVAKKIADTISSKKGFGHFTRNSSISNANEVIQYLIKYQNEYLSLPKTYLKENEITELSDLMDIKSMIGSITDNDEHYIDIEKLKSDFKPGTIIDGQVVSVQNYGVFVEFGLNATGLAHVSTFDKESSNDGNSILMSDFENGQDVKIEVRGYDDKHNKFDIIILENLEELDHIDD